ncbi:MULTISPECIES: Gfo/Idh/MocA family protein [Micromonospora]|uniref:Glucose-fructose oxidoreductase n=1 Tax=Micromonospora yangpuensis TaxID=683228 RepID=A0A1C6ULI8_9ACTN|nr:Gfo/Idh/MocA family oxidoreductase [Micromonospora yangpuensis]GGM17727.1 deoxyfructose oxidoreductase [Micromonospora yangpuensis]SCL54821.1 glucose-fructose oxidoreductase [Micromonospora yangpuensis]
MTYRVGIVGAGFLTRHSLIPALRGMPDGRLAAVLDPDPQALALTSPAWPEARYTSDEDAFFATEMDAVHVATPNHLHEHFTLRALERGLAVVVDKPLAHTVASGRAIVAAGAAAGVPAIVGYMSKHNVYNREARRLVAEGAIGTPQAMVAARLGWRKDDWRSRPAESGLGCLADLGIYPVLTAIDIFGADPVRCEATAWPVHDPTRTDLYAQATLWFDDRRYLHFETAATFHEQPASAEVASYTVIGDAGIIQVSGAWQMDGTGALELCDASGWRPAARLTPVDPYRSQYELLARAAAGEPVPDEVSLARGLRDLEILYAVADTAAARAGAAAVRLSGGASLAEAR